MILSVIPTGAFIITTSALTMDDFTYTVDGNEATITDYVGSANNLTIPSTIADYTVVKIGDSAFEDCTALKSITIPNSVTTIGGSAFLRCTELESVTIPNSVIKIRKSMVHTAIRF